VDAADARHLVVSYNTEGVVPFEELYDLLDRRGRVDLRVQDYVTYRGGRQSPGRRTHNLEFVLVVDTKARDRSGARPTVDRFLAEKRLGTLLKGAFDPGRLRAAFPGSGTTVEVAGRPWPTEALHRFVPLPDPAGLTLGQIHEAAGALEAAACRSHQEEFSVLLGLLEDIPAGPLRTRRARRLVLVLRKFAFRQYQADFVRDLARARDLARRSGDRLLAGLLDDLEPVADRRFAPK
jgi:adenine-specific DNA-methyltransferase